MIRTEIDERNVAFLTLDRPDLGNRYDGLMIERLEDRLAELARMPALRCLVIRGAGRHFCVGADIDWHAAGGPIRSGTDLTSVLLQLDRFPRPTIAVVHGACIGGGAALASCSDVVLAEQAAFFAIPETRLGLPTGALTPLFIRAIGYRQFRRYALTGERFGALRAHRIGLVHELFEREEQSVLAAVLDAIDSGAPGAVSRTKQLAAHFATAQLVDAELADLEAAFAQERQEAEALEGLASFQEKRRPEWYHGK